MKKTPVRLPYTFQRALLNVAGSIPYELGLRVFSGFFGNAVVQNVLFRKRLKNFERLTIATTNKFESRIDFTRHLLSSFIVPWQVNTLSRVDESQFRRHVRLENTQMIDELKAAKRPILLVSTHTGISRMGPLALLRLGYEFSAIEPEPYLALMGARRIEGMRSILLRGEGAGFWMKELYQSRKVLAENGILQLAMDGHQGTGGVERVFLGRRRVFHISMAKLAIELEAAIVLIAATLDEKGRVTIRFQGPVDTGDAVLPAEERLEKFLDTYVDFVENVWRTDLGNVSPRHIQRHLRSEPVPNPVM